VFFVVNVKGYLHDIINYETVFYAFTQKYENRKESTYIIMDLFEKNTTMEDVAHTIT